MKAVEFGQELICFNFVIEDGKRVWPHVALSLTFAVAKSFFGALYSTSAIIGLS